ncbi:MAG: site-specific integrase [Saprospiraceae bacterium]|nr:site-specific integrase [Saprospiraceae bacterium]
MSQDIVSVTLVLDERRSKKNGTYPVKLCICHKPTRKAKYYSTIFSFTPGEFESIWLTLKPRIIYHSVKDKMKALVDKAEKDLEDLTPFSFEAYDKKLYRSSNDSTNVFWHYNEKIQEFKRFNSYGTASWYECSRNSLQAYLKHLKTKSLDNLSFERITPKWLQQYEFFMSQDREEDGKMNSGKSKTTIAMYLRALRSVFNAAIEAKDIDREMHPFGLGKYELKEGSKVKKALSKEDLKVLFTSIAANPEQQKAKDFWFFSYLSNGMNVKDIINLRYGQIGPKSFTFERIKTQKTKKKAVIITVFISDFTRYVIQEYGNIPTGKKDQLVFPIISDQDSAAKRHIITKKFTRFINQHIKPLAIANGITGDISTYFARHSFATILDRKGAPTSFIKESLGHSSVKTTEDYLAGFQTEYQEKTAEETYKDLL